MDDRLRAVNADERRALRDRCRWVHGPGPRTPGQELARVAAWCDANQVSFDAYGEGALVQDFEAQVAERLGAEAARFMPSGTMAQQIALRVWCERAGRRHFGMHPTSHVELHEQRGYARLHGLEATLVGPAGSPLLAEHFEAVAEPLAALLVELPIREAGGQLPSWEQLEALKTAMGSSHTKLHLDGARLWECAPFYGRSYEAICAGFDSVYVSFYKGIGALAGAMLLGPRDFIEEAKRWQRRCGGNLVTLTPSVASAAMQLEERIAGMPRLHARALSMAEALSAVEGVSALPDPPHTNMMHVFLRCDAEAAQDARDRFAEARGVWLFGGARPADAPGTCRIELYVGEAALEVKDEEIVEGFRAVLSAPQA